jgi:hypothetical protein
VVRGSARRDSKGSSLGENRSFKAPSSTVPFKLNQDRRHHILRQQHKVTNWPGHEARSRAGQHYGSVDPGRSGGDTILCHGREFGQHFVHDDVNIGKGIPRPVTPVQAGRRFPCSGLSAKGKGEIRLDLTFFGTPQFH